MEEARVTELATQLEMATSTAHGYLSTLEEIGLLHKEGDVYHIGLEFLNKGGHARQRKEAYGLARQKVVELAEETDERAQFLVEEHAQGLPLHGHRDSGGPHGRTHGEDQSPPRECRRQGKRVS